MSDYLNDNVTLSCDPSYPSIDVRDQCPVCLDVPQDKALLDACLHAFCFECVLKWALISRQCPLCKQEFSFAIHSIQSDSEFTKHFFDPLKETHSVATPSLSSSTVRGAWRTSRQTNWRFRTTTLLSRENSRRSEFRARASSTTISAAKRRRKLIYQQGQRALSVGVSNQSKIKEFDSRAFKRYPEQLNKLIPWIHRELQVLLDDDDVDLIQNAILALFSRMELKSEEFKSILAEYLGEYSSHFMHELECFGASPFDMVAYDAVVQYEGP
ncbi:hypothetical protein BASA50_003434 [Batrachochytrium salamandrivorans]|uniref:RING-type E3 ubiquitin transferase n=1 Tax=Batrachochytrium salamandrivorans TaxID=1357716 RepID=A0ABQ8FIW3_9FUNG|nr:hypothetical protein BASA61_009453 [Batrachochytrium salamandrivorans]KAH6598928.1 hypothetical protein BASA50_003434 [Batrachochytrium salamandrivorans]